MEKKLKKPYSKPKLISLGKISWDEEAFEKGALRQEILQRLRQAKELDNNESRANGKKANEDGKTA